jgi:hypothetical protein
MKNIDKLSVILLGVTSSIWVLANVWRTFVNHSLNEENRGTPIYSCKSYLDGGKTVYCRVKLALSTQLDIGPGQHFNLVARHRRRGWFQSHPFIVTWEKESNGHRFLYFLVECKNGFSCSLPKFQTIKGGGKPKYVYLDGPYGHISGLKSFDTVLFCSKGIGVVSQLPLMRYLVMAHNDKTARIRRMSLRWVLESPGSVYLAWKMNRC